MDAPHYAVLASPTVGFFSMPRIGVLAGWFAERLTGCDHGLLSHLFVAGKPPTDRYSVSFTIAIYARSPS